MLSYTRGPDLPLLDVSIGTQLQRTAEKFPDRLALVSCHQDVHLTWRELLELADRVAAGLRSLGLVPGDRVGLWSTNCVEWVALHMGCARAGIVLINVNPAYRSHELAYLLRKSGMKALFLWDKDQRADYGAILAEARVNQDSALQHVIFFSGPEWQHLLTHSIEAPAQPHLDDVANIQYTSGTTGLPKGVLLTHRNVVNNGLLLARGMRYTVDDRICVPLPMYHCFGCVIGTMSALASGAAIILPNWTFDAGAALRAIEAERATSLYGVPTMFIAELEHPDFPQRDLTSLRTGMMAGAPCPVEVMRRVINEMHCRELTIGFGQTESSPVVSMSEPDDPLELRVSTVGKVLPCTEIKVVSITDGEVLPTGETGEICARGYMIMKGYDGEAEATARAVDAEGWLHTGDLGVMENNGYLRVTGRSKDVIIRGGENIYPRELEEFFYTHPKIADVQVVGVPDSRLGETVVAWIRLRPEAQATEDEIRQFCCGKIAHFKVPQRIRFVEEFPTTVTGKVQKFRIREIEVSGSGA
jgi:fatty-acyl-CoA synthase